MTTRDMVRGAVVPAIQTVTLLLSLACAGTTQEERTGAISSGTVEGTPAVREGEGAPLVPVPAHEPASSGQGPAGAGPGELTWTVPKDWIEETPKSVMRKAQYHLHAAPGDTEGGECVVYYFGAGQGGDVKSNLDRWASQFTGRGSNASKFSSTKAGGLTIDRAEVRGTYTPSPMAMGGGPEPQPKPDYMLLGAIVPGADANWFFKCTGPVKTMEANRASFDAMLGSLRPAQ